MTNTIVSVATQVPFLTAAVDGFISIGLLIVFALAGLGVVKAFMPKKTKLFD